MAARWQLCADGCAPAICQEVTSLAQEAALRQAAEPLRAAGPAAAAAPSAGATLRWGPPGEWCAAEKFVAAFARRFEYGDVQRVRELVPAPEV